MIWAIDLDGVITANPDFFKFLTYTLNKQGNEGNLVIIVSARNPSRFDETISELYEFGIHYHRLIMNSNPKQRDWKSLMEWKFKTIQSIQPDIWIDNDFKMYERVFHIDLDKLFPELQRIWI